MELNLNNKTALITGASKGIGKAIAESMANEGCNLILTARSTDKLNELKIDQNILLGQAIGKFSKIHQDEVNT